MSYATYKRRSPEDGGRSIDLWGKIIDNRWIVPYFPFLSLRYTAYILGYPIHKHFPAVMPLRVHLKDQQEIYFNENQEGEALEKQRHTELTALFEFNKKALAEGAKPGTLPRYVDMPKEHVYDKKLKICFL